MPLFTTTLTAESDLPVPIETAWATLTDFAAYSTWNPFTPEVHCTGTLGETVHATVVWLPAGRRFPRKLTLYAWDPPHTLCWGITTPLLSSRRTQSLTALTPTTTRYHTAEAFTGLLVPLVSAFYRQRLQNGFTACAAALRTHLTPTHPR